RGVAAGNRTLQRKFCVSYKVIRFKGYAKLAGDVHGELRAAVITKAWIVIESEFTVGNLPLLKRPECPVDISIIQFLGKSVKKETTALDVKFYLSAVQLEHQFNRNEDCEVGPGQGFLAVKRQSLHIET